MFRNFLFLSAIVLSQSLNSHASDWPQWRGPDGQGHAEGTNYPTQWSPTENIAWHTPLPGRGWSSPVIMGDKIWMTTALEVPCSPEHVKERLKTNTADQPLTLLEDVKLLAICVDRKTGKLQHEILLHSEKDPQWVHTLNSYASPTPVAEAGRLYCHFGTLGTFAVDTKAGKLLWKNTELKLMHENGPGSSPVLWKNQLIFHCDGSDVQYVAALDKDTGKLAWKTDRSGAMNKNPQLKKSYATPLVLPMAGKPVLFSQGADWLYGYEPETGKELWKMAYGALGFSLSARAVAGDGMLYLSTGFMRPQIQAVKYEGVSQPEIAWTFTKSAPTMPSPLLTDGSLYFVSDGGVLVSLDAKTGAENYRERLGGNFNASPILAGGRIYLFSREGIGYIITPSKTFQKAAVNELQATVMASPAAVDGALYIRTSKELLKIGK